MFLFLHFSNLSTNYKCGDTRTFSTKDIIIFDLNPIEILQNTNGKVKKLQITNIENP